MKDALELHFGSFPKTCAEKSFNKNKKNDVARQPLFKY